MSGNTTPGAEAASSGPTGVDNSGTEGARQISIGPCNICKKPCKLKCPGPCGVFYCSKDHQKQDWKIHKTQCWPLVKVENETFGRHWIASRDIKAGEFILKEKAAMWAPRIPPHTRGEVACIGSAGVLDPHANLARGSSSGTPKNSCSKCGWPVCALNCEKRPVHAKNECPIFTSGAVQFPPTETSIRSAYLGVGMLRLLLTKKKNPDLWSRINALQDEISKVEPGLEDVWKDLSPDVFRARKALNVAPELAANDAEWGRIFRMLKLNAFDYGCCSRPHFSALFERASFLTHSCVPNTLIIWILGNDIFIYVRATTNIKKGEMVTTGRIFAEDEHRETYGLGFKGTDNRLLKTRQAGFWCKCPRCVDPTELGTYASAIMCARCHRYPDTQGIMLPSTFHDLNEPYRCLTPGCENTKSRTEVITLVERLERELMNDKLHEKAERFEQFISRNSGTRLHPNHWLIIKASLEWLYLYGRTITAEGNARWTFNFTNPEQPEKLLEHCRRVADYMNKFDFGITSDRVLHLNMSAEVLRFHLEHRKEAMKLSREEEMAEWNQVLEWVSFAQIYLSLDDPDPQEIEEQMELETFSPRFEYLNQLAKYKMEEIRRSGSADVTVEETRHNGGV